MSEFILDWQDALFNKINYSFCIVYSALRTALPLPRCPAAPCEWIFRFVVRVYIKDGMEGCCVCIERVVLCAAFGDARPGDDLVPLVSGRQTHWLRMDLTAVLGELSFVWTGIRVSEIYRTALQNA